MAHGPPPPTLACLVVPSQTDCWPSVFPTYVHTSLAFPGSLMMTGGRSPSGPWTPNTTQTAGSLETAGTTPTQGPGTLTPTTPSTTARVTPASPTAGGTGVTLTTGAAPAGGGTTWATLGSTTGSTAALMTGAGAGVTPWTVQAPRVRDITAGEGPSVGERQRKGDGSGSGTGSGTGSKTGTETGAGCRGQRTGDTAGAPATAARGSSSSSSSQAGVPGLKLRRPRVSCSTPPEGKARCSHLFRQGAAARALHRLQLTSHRSSGLRTGSSPAGGQPVGGRGRPASSSSSSVRGTRQRRHCPHLQTTTAASRPLLHPHQRSSSSSSNLRVGSPRSMLHGPTGTIRSMG